MGSHTTDEKLVHDGELKARYILGGVLPMGGSEAEFSENRTKGAHVFLIF
jgi:hypothetical protein